MMRRCDNWPLVLPNDDGIRPAGEPDECFYCRKKVGFKHGPRCVTVSQHVEMRVFVCGNPVGYWREFVPYDWDAYQINFRYNESTWCADNAKATIEWDPTPEAAKARTSIENRPKEDGCCCGLLSFCFARVIDHGPFVEVPDEKS